MEGLVMTDLERHECKRINRELALARARRIRELTSRIAELEIERDHWRQRAERAEVSEKQLSAQLAREIRG